MSEGHAGELAILSQARVRHDEHAAARCIQVYTSMLETCTYDGRERSDAACSKIFSGTVANAECAPVLGQPAFCGDSLAGDGEVCKQQLSEGETCWLEGCQAGLFCDISQLECVPLLSEGQCLQINACVPSAFCSAGLRCEPKKEAGESCLDSLDCRSGVCSRAGTCVNHLAQTGLCSGE